MEEYENELDKLRAMLRLENIPFESECKQFSDELKEHYCCRDVEILYGSAAKYDKNQIIYGRISEQSWLFDGICHYGSYGAKQGLIETYGDLGADEKFNPRVMTAEEAFAIIQKHWEEHKNDKSRKHRNVGF